MAGQSHLAVGFIFLFVIPAKAGIQGCKSVLVALDPGFRRGDGRKNGPDNAYAIPLPWGVSDPRQRIK